MTVHVKTEQAAEVGAKLVGRHGNKGIIVKILPNSEMPSREVNGEKDHMDLLLNPLIVPGRINLGQVFETSAGKVAVKRGKTYKIRNFEPGSDNLEDLKAAMKAAKVKDREALVNPDTGKPYQQDVLTGRQYVFKLKHQAIKKSNARSGGPGMPYDINHAPIGGSKHGGSTIGELGMYSMLAHGATENLYEMQAYKTGKNDELWDAIREGLPIPPPKTPFAYEKFLKYLNGMRVNVKKEGNHLVLVPFTEKQVRAQSHG